MFSLFLLSFRHHLLLSPKGCYIDYSPEHSSSEMIFSWTLYHASNIQVYIMEIFFQQMRPVEVKYATLPFAGSVWYGQVSTLNSSSEELVYLYPSITFIPCKSFTNQFNSNPQHWLALKPSIGWTLLYKNQLDLYRRQNGCHLIIVLCFQNGM